MSTVDSSNSSAWSQSLSSMNGALSSHLQDKMLKKMDTDGSGGVDQSEFQAALEKLAGKLGIEVGEGGSELYASLDSDQDGSLNGNEVGAMMQSMFGAMGGTQAFVQSRGDEARFAELDADGDHMISMEEFGIVPAGTTVVTTTTTTTTTSGDGALADSGSGSSFSDIAGSLLAAAIAGAISGGGDGGGGEEVAAAEEGGGEEAVSEVVAEAPTNPLGNTTVSSKPPSENSRMDAVIQAADKDGNGRISSGELQTLVAKMGAQQSGAASRRYSDTALAQLGASQRPAHSRLNATA
ncbi:hypothetical protein [Hydrogenophaga sp. RWCD_12]|uniref:hypothetical protein n=1 Tax=Hydrogenophaga sp. RWCD_12 TaxID=3391190 RepID=UPI003985131D